MPWFYVDDDAAFNKKIVAAGNPAVGLWTRAGSWSRKEGTAGFIPKEMAKTLGTAAQSKKLVEVRLWYVVEGGYQFHQWDDRYETDEQVEAKRQKRAAAGRLGGLKSGRSRRGRPANAEANAEANASATSLPTASAFAEADTKQKRTHVLVPERDTSGISSQAANGPDARERDEPPLTGPPIRPDAWRLVRAAIPAEHPHATRTALALETGALLVAGTPPGDVEAALGLWLAKPHLGPKTLPSLVSEVIRNRDRPAAGAVPGPVLSTADRRVAQAQALKSTNGFHAPTPLELP